MCESFYILDKLKRINADGTGAKGAIFGESIFLACHTQSVPLDPCENER